MTFIIYLILLACGWGMVANLVTARQRHKIIDRCYRSDDWRIRKKVLEDVTYDEHLFYVVTFRNPYVMYPAWARPGGV